jgi:hypothetical protein
MKSRIVKRSIVLDGHKTSVSLEDQFWSGLKEIARAQVRRSPRWLRRSTTLANTEICPQRSRLFVLDQVRTEGTTRANSELHSSAHPQAPAILA